MIASRRVGQSDDVIAIRHESRMPNILDVIVESDDQSATTDWEITRDFHELRESSSRSRLAALAANRPLWRNETLAWLLRLRSRLKDRLRANGLLSREAFETADRWHDGTIAIAVTFTSPRR